ncbi:TetR/AcrR family transcriptional regulator [Streptomyces flavidovirens]|uniref:TetR/AcrR family transcriptional regulator n=1 Tax=Streptomyces flavidovirens TaxID=67298 RepID=UPI000422EEDF|nr:TetR/AcrR family transcriptional regulator [Streptomyces flavidovirens]
MAQQQRSVLTRRALLDAAAREIGEHGPSGAAMHRIAWAAEVSMGALTFHFPTKDRLVAELVELGLARIAEKVREVTEPPASPLRRARMLLFTLMELLHRDAVVRAAARLTEELPGVDGWARSWLPVAREMFQHAEESGQLRSGVTPEAVTEMALYIVSGAEVRARSHELHGEDMAAARARFTQVCDLLLYGVSAVQPTGSG